MLRFWLVLIGLTVTIAGLLAGAGEANATIQRIYTHPFYDSYTLGYGFGGYPGHVGTDYFVGVYASGGERIAAADSGTVGLFQQFPVGAGYAVFIDHGNGHKTQYMHMSSRTVTTGQLVA